MKRSSLRACRDAGGEQGRVQKTLVDGRWSSRSSTGQPDQADAKRPADVWSSYSRTMAIVERVEFVAAPGG